MDEQSPGHRGSHTMQKASKPKTSTPRQRGGKSAKTSKTGKSNRQQNAKRVVGAAEFRPARRIGMKDLMAHEVSYLAGYVYVGNGTLGATDGVYYQNVAKTEVAQPNNSPSEPAYHVPILPNSAKVGSTYVSDVGKHFARMRVRRARVELVSLQPATSNSMVAQLAPVRGAGDSDDLNFATGTTAALALADAIGMDGSKQCASWEGLTCDLTPYIAGGSGALQNEFNNDYRADTLVSTEFKNLNGIAPCCIAISGQNNTTALRGTQTHMIIVHLTLDYLDFIAGNSLDIAAAPAAARDITSLIRHLVEVEGASALDRVLRHIEPHDPKLTMRLRALCSGK